MMKFGLLTSICEGMTFEEVVNFAAENQLECLEVACWPQGGAQRRYAGVSHIDRSRKNRWCHGCRTAVKTNACQRRTALCRCHNLK